ncbi:hypothetical protein SAMN04488096_101442 [Mesonia phycicola]|uniref:Tetratricopeptide repeat-containing protein n=1 Tax=Mesonia phycicola TaxID=579105 RepID=A0A1M6ATZ2_9FLAO|nr:hypothetical protein [Mesonia phycicola]SHI39930.1 hypothetical protein SAMN04488096_101442 [Mesonia phycicola]
MLKDYSDPLFSLIKTLSASEKRQFSLYAGRMGGKSERKFEHLFKILSKQKSYDELEILSKTSITKQQLSNVKAHLYKQILVSLRLNPSQQNIPLQLREQLDFAYILYRKGLYKQALKLLDKTKISAIEYEEKNIAFEVLDLEKIIESQYITRSLEHRADDLVNQTEELSVLNVIAGKLSNLSLQLYNIFLKMGYARTEEEAQEITSFFEENLPVYNYKQLSFREKLWLYQSYLWYSFITQDFLSCYRYASKWVDLFQQNPTLIKVHPVFYIKGNHYLLEALFYLNSVSLFERVLADFEKNIQDKRIPKDENILVLSFMYLYFNKLNLRFMKGEFANGDSLVNEITRKIKLYQNSLDEHHIMVLYYKIASLYFGDDNYEKCIEFLQKIIQNKSLEMREDLMCFSRILNLVAHYEAGLDYQLDKLIRSTYRFLIKMNDLHEVQKEMIKFLRHLPNVYPSDIKAEFKKLRDRLKVYEEHPFERRAFLYLDIISWLESNFENRPVAEIIKEKFNE